MEQSHHLLDLIHSYFPHESADIRTISPLKLAYLGDAVYEIIIRTLIMERTGGPVKNLHNRGRKPHLPSRTQRENVFCGKARRHS